MRTNSLRELYNEAWRRKLEEHWMKMEKLRLRHLSTAAAAGSANVEPSPVKKAWGELALEDESIQRTGKNIIFVAVPHPLEDFSGWVCSYDIDRAYAMERAEKVEAELGTNYPSFVKPMRVSHLTGSWIGLPFRFCNKYLPKSDLSIITLIDEEGKKSTVSYLAKKRRLSTGWRGFSADYELVDGDVLVFQLIKKKTFKEIWLNSRMGMVRFPLTEFFLEKSLSC